MRFPEWYDKFWPTKGDSSLECSLQQARALDAYTSISVIKTDSEHLANELCQIERNAKYRAEAVKPIVNELEKIRGLLEHALWKQTMTSSKNPWKGLKVPEGCGL